MMLKKMVTLIPLLLFTATPVFANFECIAFSNYTSVVIDVEPMPSPGEGTPIQPKSTLILNGDRRGLCEQNNCRYFVTSDDHNSMTIIDGVPPGSHIIYGGKNLFYVDKNAHVEC